MRNALLILTTALAMACSRSATESHTSSQAGATARAGVANPTDQPEVTLTGCLRNADRSDAEPTGTAGEATGRLRTEGAPASRAEARPKNERAEAGGSARSAADQMNAGKGSIGERFTLTYAKSGSAESSPSAGSYILDGNMSDLRSHVDQQVRVKGTLDAAAANTAGPQRIRVQSVEMIDAACVAR
jgi:hypothetical protein